MLQVSRAEKIGFIGLGRMGSLLAERLSSDGWSLILYDTDLPRLHELKTTNREIHDCPADVFAGSRVQFLCLPDDQAVLATAIAENGFLKNRQACKGGYCIDLSTIGLGTSRRMAGLCEECDISYLDSPMSGATFAAETGDLALMVGGATDALNFVEPLLNCIAKKIVHMGRQGNGVKTKLLHNMVGEIQVHAFGEALAAAEVMGLNPHAFYDALSAGMASSKILTRLFRSAIFGSDQDVTVPMSNAVKDQQLLRELAQDYSLELQTPSMTLDRIQHFLRNGCENDDVTSIREYFRAHHQT